MFIKLTSFFDTPIYVRLDLIAAVEGYTHKPRRDKPFGEDLDHPLYDHVGARLTVMTSDGSESWVCQETAEAVIRLIDESLNRKS